jgi:hypothetical protein
VSTIAALHGGAAPNHYALHDAVCARWIDRLIYLPEIETDDLTDIDTVILPARLHRERLHAARPHLLDHLDHGGTIVVFGDQPVYSDHPHGWLPGVHWEHRPTNYWWWLDPDQPPPVVAAEPRHSLFDHIHITDATWHHHGILHPADGAETVISTPASEAILTIDKVTTPGTMIVTTLDPLYHHGSFFMPATTRFLTGFLPWLAGVPANPETRPYGRSATT